MRATDNLCEDHEFILEAIGLLDQFCTILESGNTVDTSHLQIIMSFIRSYADGYHHRKEEVVLFPALISKGIPNEFGPIGCMLHEHETGREYVRNMAQALTAMKAGSKDVIGLFTSAGRRYISLLSNHIMKENNVLFPLANRLLIPEEHERIIGDFHHISEDLPSEDQPQKHLEKLESLRILYMRPRQKKLFSDTVLHPTTPSKSSCSKKKESLP